MFRNFLLNSNPVYWYIHTCHNTNSISYRNFVISHAKNWAHLHNLLIFSMSMYYKLCPHICKYLFPNVSAECTCNCLKIPILTLWYLCHIHRKSINGYSGNNVSQDLLVISTPPHYLLSVTRPPQDIIGDRGRGYLYSTRQLKVLSRSLIASHLYVFN